MKLDYFTNVIYCYHFLGGCAVAGKPHDLMKSATVIRDRPDLRDLIYAPTLRVLKPTVVPARGRFAAEGFVRNQWDRHAKRFVGNCTAQALANIVDLSNRMEETLHLEEVSPAGAKELAGDDKNMPKNPKVTKASAGMLYHRGREVEAVEQGAVIGGRKGADDEETPDGLRSLRSALKGFYHNGVCSEEVWNGRRKLNGMADSVEVASDAKRTPLGSYYRLDPILNDYHAALNEVGMIYAAAEIHEGWEELIVAKNGGVIELPKNGFGSGGAVGNHAFVIVGYTPQGFLVLNSWGEKWGLYDPGKGTHSEDTGYPGVALWRYQDWAERIIDGWVLRLGVAAPEAFKYSFGPQGLAGFIAGKIASAPTPRHELVGHYIHIDDGKLVETGTLPTAPNSIAATRNLIDCRYKEKQMQAPALTAQGEKRIYKHVLLWIAGGNEPTKEIANQIGATKDQWKDKGIYPITVIWCSDFIESALNLLDRAFQDAKAKVGKEGPSLDARAEAEARGVGRAFWRDIKLSAEKAAAKDKLGDDIPGDGGMYAAFQQLMELDPEITLHVVAEGAGAILLAELLGQLTNEEAQRIASITLNMPACTVGVFEKRFVSWIEATGNAIEILVPDGSAEKRLRVGIYGGSLLKLVQMSFEETPPVRKPLGMGLEAGKIQKRAPKSSRILGLRRIAEEMAKQHARKVAVGLLKGPVGDQPIHSMRNITTSADAFNVIEAIVEKAASRTLGGGKS